MPEAVDLSALLELRKLQSPGKPDVVARVLDRFYDESAERLTALRQALATDDAPRFERAAHALKGIAGTVGAREVADLAVQLELTGREGRLQAAAGLVDDLDAALERVKTIFTLGLSTDTDDRA